ncbi:MAG: bifunctional 23S rRNA (guanine(2069)-N(7))-methyltransferase RlmK/23S rRNA (guanine(2445)-N(2))-methyltransferase RlmL [Steroidobacteraceae bacterium]
MASAQQSGLPAIPGGFIASCPRGLGDLLAAELRALGAVDVRERSGRAEFRGSLATAYRACLESRIANRVFLEVARFDAASAEQLYARARELDWSLHLGPGATLASAFSGHHPSISHTHFGALKLKDAVCDELRERAGARPDVARERPSVRVHAHASGTSVTLAIDLAGESLHRRGYRAEAGEAPLKENVAAGLLLRCGWRELAAGGAPFLDPLCGSGTLVIEAALIAADIAPGLGRDYFGFLGWRGHDAALWQRVRQEAEERARLGLASAARLALRGRDRDRRVIETARRNAERAGVAALVRFEVGALADAQPGGETPECETPPTAAAPLRGLVCTNPPYGARLEDREGARAVHRELGAVLRERFSGWDAAVLTGAPELGMELGIRAHRTHVLWNGAIECRLLRMRISPESLREPGRLAKRSAAERAAELAASPGARMFGNRIAKNLKRVAGWAKRAGIGCYRLYDADMPEYAFAIDRYEVQDDDRGVWLQVQEYAAPAEIEAEAVRRRRSEALAALPAVTGVPSERIRLKTRRRMQRGEQYAKSAERGRFLTVTEGGLQFAVNFDDYLDTGLYLDHRMTRARLREAARGKRFLNLFCYTGSATVYAAAGGARATVSVDLSRTYLEWSRRNLALNGVQAKFSPEHGPEHGPASARSPHALVQADCREWLREHSQGGPRGRGRVPDAAQPSAAQLGAEQPGAAADRFDLIFLDPPTFSNSKRMEGVLDIGRDHPELIDACARLLAPQGLIVFSTNAQRFKLDESLLERYDVRDISAATIPRDYERNPKIHRCYEIRIRGKE